MTGKIHMIAGVGTVAALTVLQPDGFTVMGQHITPLFAILTAAAGSYAPDIDMQTTHAGKKHKFVSGAVNKFGGGHRGITHTLLVPILLCVALYATAGLNLPLIPSLIFGFLAGYVLHLFADMFNGKGIPLFWPVMKGKVHIMDVPSNGAGAWLWLIAYMAVVLFIVYERF